MRRDQDIARHTSGSRQQWIRNPQEPAQECARGFRCCDASGRERNRVIGLDTNVLVRYYVGDETDEESRRQRESARKLIESRRPLAVCKTVLLELEWLLRGYYKFASADIATVFKHLLEQTHLSDEDRAAVERAVQLHATGLDFADALHHASYADCDSMSTFDDRRFARRAKKLNLAPPVSVLRQGTSKHVAET